MTVNPTDKFLVNRSGSSYNVEQQNLMAQLQDDDLLLVNRNSTSPTKSLERNSKDSLSSPPIIQSVTLTEDDPAGDALYVPGFHHHSGDAGQRQPCFYQEHPRLGRRFADVNDRNRCDHTGNQR